MQIDRETILQIAREEGMLLPSGPYFAEYEAATLSFATRIARQAAEAAPVPLSDEMPEGWQMVPIQITEEMEVAAENDYEMNSTYFPRWGGAYQAMLAAAPRPPEAAGPEVAS